MSAFAKSEMSPQQGRVNELPIPRKGRRIEPNSRDEVADAEEHEYRKDCEKWLKNGVPDSQRQAVGGRRFIHSLCLATDLNTIHSLAKSMALEEKRDTPLFLVSVKDGRGSILI